MPRAVNPSMLLFSTADAGDPGAHWKSIGG
jgi:hypothetical protein